MPPAKTLSIPKIKCCLCKQLFSSNAIHSHVRHMHTINLEEYNELVIKKLFDSTLGKKIITEYSETKLAKPIAKKYRNQGIRLKQIKELLKFANVLIRTISSEKVKCIICHNMFSVTSLSLHVRSNHNMSFTDYNNKRIKILSNTNIGKNIVKDYKSGQSLRVIIKKYGVKKIDVKRILKLYDVRIKKCTEYHRCVRARTYFYENEYYQGIWELKFCWWLKFHNICFERTIKPLKYYLNGKDHLYYPDFYLTKEDRYIEIKGVMTAADALKMTAVKKENTEVAIEIYDGNYLRKLNVFRIDKILHRNVYDYEISLKNYKLLVEQFLKCYAHNRDEILSEFLFLKRTVKKTAALKLLRIKYNLPRKILDRVFKIWMNDAKEIVFS